MKVIFKTQIKREKGKLYFVKSDILGNLMICETEMARKGRPSKKHGKK